MEKPFVFDLDENDLPKLTADNVERINFIIENDSNYRIFEDRDNENSISNLIKNNPNADKWSEDFILKLVIEIDNQNSTHQNSSGTTKGDGKGREKTAKYIYDNWPKLLSQIKSGKPEAVNIIAKALLQYDPESQSKPKNKGRYTFSFASKFCTYVSNALYNCNCSDYTEDAYSIYDNVVCDVLPYYAWKYLEETDYVDRKNSNIAKKYGGANNDRGNYKDYRTLIDRIINENEKQIGYKITRRDFDHLLWYYFKGDKDIIDNGNYMHKSRITKALEKVIEAKKRNIKQ